MTRRSRGRLFVISAPSGAGKTTLARRVVRADKRIRESVSYTSRQPREGEVDGRDYTFVSVEEFRRMIKDGEFVEWAEVHGNFYGTSKKRLTELMTAGFDVLFDIDTQGAAQLRKVFPEGVSIFVLPPSLQVLRQRLEQRAANTKEDMDRRLRNAMTEMKRYKQYDYVIVNEHLKDAVADLRAIIRAERLRTGNIDRTWLKKNLFCEEEAPWT